MFSTVIEAKSKEEALQKYKEQVGESADEAIECDSGDPETRAWMCFASQEDARIWLLQK